MSLVILVMPYLAHMLAFDVPNKTIALAGVGVSYKLAPQAMVFAGAGVGVEVDANTSSGSYSATGVNLSPRELQF